MPEDYPQKQQNCTRCEVTFAITAPMSKKLVIAATINCLTPLLSFSLCQKLHCARGVDNGRISADTTPLQHKQHLLPSLHPQDATIPLPTRCYHPSDNKMLPSLHPQDVTIPPPTRCYHYSTNKMLPSLHQQDVTIPPPTRCYHPSTHKMLQSLHPQDVTIPPPTR